MPCTLFASLAPSLLLLQTGGGTSASDASAKGSGAIDLSGEELPPLELPGAGASLQSWLERISLWGYGAAAYVDTGGTGAHKDGAFLIPDATLFLEALATARSSFFLELLLERNNSIDYYDSLEVGELYLRFRDVVGEEGEDKLGVKVGRFDIPFGEDYLRFDSVDNPLVTNSAAFPYAFDEGALAYGKVGGLGWITSVSNGSMDKSSSDGPAKSWALKLYGEPLEGLYLSASGLTTGEVHLSALQLSGYFLSAVGCYGPSTAGVSPSDTVKGQLWEADAVLRGERWELLAGFGQAFVDDEVSAFDRDISYYELEPLFRITPELYVAARYSSIGTLDADEGYRFDGAFTGGGDVFGYDTHRLWRVSLGLGWVPSPNLTFKLEAGRDGFDLIDGSPFEAENDERTYFGGEIVLAF